MKSLCKQNKPAYHFVMKQLLLNRGMRWTDLPSEIVPESLVQEIRNLIMVSDLQTELTQITVQKQQFEVIRISPVGSQFKRMLGEYCRFYEEQYQSQLVSLSNTLQIAANKLQTFLDCDDLSSSLADLVTFLSLHQAFAVEVKSEKAYKRTNVGPHPPITLHAYPPASAHTSGQCAVKPAASP